MFLSIYDPSLKQLKLLWSLKKLAAPYMRHGQFPALKVYERRQLPLFSKTEIENWNISGNDFISLTPTWRKEKGLEW